MKLFIQASAEEDLLSQFEWYVEQARADIAFRFSAAVQDAIHALAAMPGAGTPRHTTNPTLAGLKTWAVKGFDEFRVYYLPSDDSVTVVRILHSKRDIGSILEDQAIEDPGLH